VQVLKIENFINTSFVKGLLSMHRFNPKTIAIAKLSLFVLLFCLSSSTSFALDAAKHFNMACSPCHTIGGGDTMGPDLQGVSERRDNAWLKKFITDPMGMINSGDAIAIALLQEFENIPMPAQNLSDQDIEGILDYIEGAGAPPAPAAKTATTADDVTREQVEAGRAVFLGYTRFVHGGPSCLSCHNAGREVSLGGGTLGPDLTNAYSDYSDMGLTTVLSQISFPSMITVYLDKPLTEDEVFTIKAFLSTVDEGDDGSNGGDNGFIIRGLIGLVIALILINFIWLGRRKKTTYPKG
jgi:mono/diheme cytochrome c family protein